MGRRRFRQRRQRRLQSDQGRVQPLPRLLGAGQVALAAHRLQPRRRLHRRFAPRKCPPPPPACAPAGTPSAPSPRPTASRSCASCAGYESKNTSASDRNRSQSPPTRASASAGRRSAPSSDRRRAGRDRRRRRRRLRRAQRRDGCVQFVRLDRLGDVAVHAGRQAALAVALHGVGGHGDDRACAGPSPASRRADRGRRLEAVHLRHLHVHQHQVERLLAPAPPAPRGRCRRRRPRGPASPAGATASFWLTALSSASRMRSGRRPAGARRRAGRRAEPGVQRRAAQRGQDRVQQLRLLDRLRQVGARCPARGSAPTSSGWPAEVSIISVGAGQLRSPPGSARPA